MIHRLVMKAQGKKTSYSEVTLRGGGILLETKQTCDMHRSQSFDDA